MSDAPQDRANDSSRRPSVYDQAENVYAGKWWAELDQDASWARGEASSSDPEYYAKHAKRFENGRVARSVAGYSRYNDPSTDSLARPSKGKHGKPLRKNQ